MSTIKATVLGCSGSNGVPATGYGWGDCDPTNPKNNRMRPSILLQKDGYSLVIDAGPDIRHQLTRAGVWTIDAVIFTHPHFDHIGGIGDLFGICHQRRETLPFYCDQTTASTIYERNRYAFERLTIKTVTDQALPMFALNVVPVDGQLQVGPFLFHTFALDHHDTITMGLRIGDFAYLIDFRRLDDSVFDKLHGLTTLIIDGNNPSDRPDISLGHIDAARGAEYAVRIGAKRSYLSSLPAWHDYDRLAATLPKNVEPAFDGLDFSISD